MRVSFYVCLYQDPYFLGLAVERIYDLADEIVIVDGPYRWLEEWYEGFPFPPRTDLAQVLVFGTPILNLPKVRYLAQTWDNQAQKRAAAYAACTGDVVCVMDADEIWLPDSGAVEKFYASSASAAALETIQLCRSYAALGCWAADLSFNAGRTMFAQKKVFRRSHVSAEEHLDYIWLIYHEGGAAIKEIYGESLGTLYNAILMRPKDAQFYKYLHYRANFLKNRSRADIILTATHSRSYSDLSKNFTIEQIREMVLRSTFDSIRVPAEYAISKEYEGKESIQKCLVEFDGAEEEYGIDIAGKFPVHHLMPLLFYVPAVLARESLVLECSLSRGNRIAASDHVFRYGVDNRGRRNAVQARIRNGNAQLLLEAPSANGPEIFARVIRFLFIDELRDRAEIKSIRLSRAG